MGTIIEDIFQQGDKMNMGSDLPIANQESWRGSSVLEQLCCPGF